MVITTNKEESSLIKALKSGEDLAFEEIYEEYKHSIFKMAYRFSSDPYHADNICQETMYRIYKGINKMKGTSKLSTWIYRVAYNTCIDNLRKNKKHSNISIDSTIDIFDKDSKVGKYDALSIVLSKLKKKERDILILFYIDNFSISDLSEILGVSKSNAILFRARKKAAEVAYEMR